MNESHDLFKYLKSLVDFDSSDLELLNHQFHKTSHKAGHFIFQAGESSQKVGFITAGLVKKFYITFDGKEFIKEFSSTGEFIAPYSSLLQNKPAHFSIQCLEDTETLTADWNYIQKLFSTNIRWMELGKKIAEIHFIAREQREAEFLQCSAKERLKLFKSHYPQLVNKLKKQDIAAYLGITPVSLSRLLGSS